jgi:peptidoglycan/LPS O-acetylase OafA/YrhL
MTNLQLILLFDSLAILALGVYIWRLTSSRGVMLITMLGTLGMLMAAAQAQHPPVSASTVIIPFFVTMLFGGRAMGIWWRSREEKEMRRPARLMSAVAALALGATISAFATL